MKISKDKAREQILDMVGDLFHATVAEMTMPRIYDGRTWEKAKSAVNAAFDSIEDHPKVVLPQEVGEAWVEYVDSRQTVRGIDKLGRTSFTRAELKQYHLDSDIFTLVPAEDEK